jgi:hypothetical protein
MRHIYNIGASERGLRRLRLELERIRPAAGDVVALTYMSRFVDRNGITIAGFVPGYSAGPVEGGEFGDLWAMAHLSYGTSFLFMPKFVWRAEATYVVDVASPYTLSIEPAEGA